MVYGTSCPCQSATGARWKRHPFTRRQKKQFSSLHILQVCLHIASCPLLTNFLWTILFNRECFEVAESLQCVNPYLLTNILAYSLQTILTNQVLDRCIMDTQSEEQCANRIDSLVMYLIWAWIKTYCPLVNQHAHGKSHFLMGESTINGRFQWLYQSSRREIPSCLGNPAGHRR